MPPQLLALLLAAAPPVADDAHDLILLHPKRPYRVRLHLRVESASFKAAWNRQVGRLFAHLDRDGDSRLSAAEASRAPSREQWLQMTNGKEQIDADAAPAFAELARGRAFATVADVRAYYASTTSGPLQASWAWGPLARQRLAEPLWAKLDADRDGKLSRDELLAARRVLSPLDSDDDDLLSQPELTGNSFFLGPPVATAGPAHGLAHGGMPFVSALPNGPKEPIDAILKKKYNRSFPSGPDIELTLSLDDPTRPARKLAGPPDTFSATPRGEQLRLEEWRIDILRPLPLSRRGESRKKDATAAFRQLDANKDQRLDSGELYAPPFQFVSWLRLADRDGDGKLSEREFLDYWSFADSVRGSVTFLQVENQGRSLFHLMDQNDDGRLGVRELNEAWSALAPWSAGQGHFTRETLPQIFRLTIGHGSRPLAASAGEAVPIPLRRPSRGPVWFRKMDKNGDGDVSRREWLGSRELFDKFDLDGDGLIGIEEALRVDPRR